MGLSRSACFSKRTFDVCVSLCGLLAFSVVIFICWLISSITTASNGFFIQKRIGKNGVHFSVIKIRTMYQSSSSVSMITTVNDPRITKAGAIMRRYKLDELPQLWNVLIGDMSFVGPRPDVPGFADELKGEYRQILDIRPGITGPASIKYSKEEVLLATVEDPIYYNRNVIWPDKVKINIKYIQEWSFIGDIKYIFKLIV
jgi:lipopolysaccharide/colanic/teichoic acid biosynthesis glycosyltransferase